MQIFNAAQAILRRARTESHTFSEKVALIAGATTITYGELSDRVDRAGEVLLDLGVRPGDRIGLLLNDSPLAGAAFLGAVQRAIVPIPLNSRLPGPDYTFIAQDADLRLMLVEPEHRALVAHLPADIRMIAASGAPDSFAARLAAAKPKARVIAETKAGDAAFWLYSSGTTGRPKGIIHSHHTCAASGMLLRQAIGASASSVILTTSKMFFAYGLENGLLAPLALGATSIQFPQWPDPAHVLEQAERHRATCMLTVPTFYRRLLQLGPAELARLSSVERFYTGGERLPEPVAREWEAATGRPLHVGYGLSETHCNVTANFPGRNRSPASIGELLEGIEARLLERDGTEVAHGEPGVLWVKHPTLAIGYTDPALTGQAFRDGWFCTNDLCTMDADGFLYHLGRADELMKIAGQWVKPADIEEVALATQGVREAACVITADADGFERIALFVVPNGSLDDMTTRIIEQCDARLPSFSRPKWVRTVDELPKNATGKIQRFRLRALIDQGHDGARPLRATDP